MTILSAQLDSAGMGGVIPKIIYIHTDNTVDEVIADGFLNGLAKQNLGLALSDIALVVTQATPSSQQATAFYTVSFSDGNWTLTAV